MLVAIGPFFFYNLYQVDYHDIFWLKDPIPREFLIEIPKGNGWRTVGEPMGLFLERAMMIITSKDSQKTKMPGKRHAYVAFCSPDCWVLGVS